MKSPPVSDVELAGVVEAIKKIASVPAGPFHEENRHPVIKWLLSEWAPGLPFVVDAVGNVAAWLEAGGKKPPLVLSAHLDTVFPLDEVTVTEDEQNVYGPGVSDDASGLASLLYLAKRLRDCAPQAARGVIFAFTVGEEGAGGLRGVKHLMDFLLGRKEDAAFSGLLPEHAQCPPSVLIAVDGTLGTVVSKGLHIKRRRMVWSGPGGHSWGAAGRPSAIAAAARAVAGAYRIRYRRGHTTVNVGTISGGMSVNAIAAECSVEIEVRSVSKARVEAVMGRIISVAEEAAAKVGVHVRIEMLDERPGGTTRASHRCVRLLEENLRSEGISPLRAVSSTEANIAMAEDIPAIATGVVVGSGVHTMEEKFCKESLRQGLAVLFNYVRAMME